MDLNVGRLVRGGDVQLEPQRLEQIRRLAAEKPHCERCFCRWSCAGGCHVNHSHPGWSGEYDDFCIQTRLISACSLLDALGDAPAVRALLNNRPALQSLALRPSDRMEDWQEADHG
jgi:hypothetical protein